jgi:hypothetical protein
MSKLEWTVRLYVDPKWVEDGFNLTDEKAREMIEQLLPFAYSSELGAKVIDRPHPKIIRQLQGYPE